MIAVASANCLSSNPTGHLGALVAIVHCLRCINDALKGKANM